MGVQSGGSAVGEVGAGKRLEWKDELRYENDNWVKKSEVEKLLVDLCLKMGVTAPIWLELQDQKVVNPAERNIGEAWWQATKVQLIERDTFTVSFPMNLGKK